MRLQSVQTHRWNPYVLETFQPYRPRATAVNPLKSQDFHLISTAGESASRKTNFRLENSLRRARKRSSARNGPRIRRTPTTEDDENIKDRLEALLFAETLQGPCPRMRTPERGQLEAY